MTAFYHDGIVAPSDENPVFSNRTGGFYESRIPCFLKEMTREEELQKEGWIKRFTTDEPRLTEAVQQYEEIGFEVLLEPLDPQAEECTICLTGFSDRYKTIYTRRRR
jgi:hypothetical protein